MWVDFLGPLVFSQLQLARTWKLQLFYNVRKSAFLMLEQWAQTGSPTLSTLDAMKLLEFVSFFLRSEYALESDVECVCYKVKVSFNRCDASSLSSSCEHCLCQVCKNVLFNNHVQVLQYLMCCHVGQKPVYLCRDCALEHLVSCKPSSRFVGVICRVQLCLSNL